MRLIFNTLKLMLLAALLGTTMTVGYFKYFGKGRCEPAEKAMPKEPEKAGNGYRYTDNYKYALMRNLFRIYRTRQANIVMLGDSLVFKAAWNELLGRSDVASRGISSDILEGFYHRISDVVELQPRFCFIMGGINDILAGIPKETTFHFYTRLASTLREHRITPVIQSTLYLSDQWPSWKEANHKVKQLNSMLEAYAKRNDIPFLDVNAALSNSGKLNPEYTYDGLHLRAPGYRIWRDLVLHKLEALDPPFTHNISHKSFEHADKGITIAQSFHND